MIRLAHTSSLIWLVASCAPGTPALELSPPATRPEAQAVDAGFTSTSVDEGRSSVADAGTPGQQDAGATDAGSGGGGGDGGDGFALAADGFVVRRSDGARLLPLGLWNTPNSALPELRASGHTFASRFDAEVASDRTWLSALASHGLLGMPGIDVSQVSELTDDEAQTFAREYVEGLAGAPAPLAYLAPDEGITLELPVSRLIAVRDGLRDADPNALVVYDDWVPETAIAAKPAYDIFCWDSYPIGTMGEGDIESWRAELRTTRRHALPKAFWLAFQGWVMPPGWMEPTNAELRVMAYLGLANGATGLLTFAYDYGPYGTGITDYPTLWSEYKALFSELSALTPVLTLPRSGVRVSVSRPGIDLLLKDGATAGRWYLIAVNYLRGSPAGSGHHSGAPIDGAVFAFGGALATGTASVRLIAGGTGTLPWSGEGFVDDFAPYDAKVYEISKP